MGTSENLISYSSLDEATAAANENQNIAAIYNGDGTRFVPVDDGAVELGTATGIIALYDRLRASFDSPDLEWKPTEVAPGMVSIPEDKRPCYQVFDKWTKFEEHNEKDKPWAPGVYLFGIGKTGRGKDAVPVLTQPAINQNDD
jgi:hypothetical protein